MEILKLKWGLMDFGVYREILKLSNYPTGKDLYLRPKKINCNKTARSQDKIEFDIGEYRNPKGGNGINKLIVQ